MTSNATHGKPFDLEAPDRILADVEYLRSFRHSKTRLVSAAAAIHGLTLDIVCGERQARNIAHKRFRIYYLFHLMGYSYPGIGRMMNKNHTTALYGVQRVIASLEVHRQAQAALRSHVEAA